MPPDQPQEQSTDVQGTQTPQLKPSIIKDKFKLFSAIRPALGAIKHNLGLVSLGVIVSILLLILEQQIFSPLGSLQINGTGPQQQLPLWTIPAYILFMLIGVFVGTYSYLLIADGAHGERERLITYIRVAAKKYWRVLASYILGLIAIILPVIGVGIITGAFWAVGTLTEYRVLDVFNIILLVFVAFGAYIWFLVATIRFSMVGFIALFEPDIIIRNSLRRSWQLLEGTGEWFVVKLGLTIWIVLGVPWLIVFFQVLQKSSIETLQNVIMLASLLYVPVGIFVGAMLVTLYLNRLETKPPFQANQSALRGWKWKSFIILIIVSAAVLGISTPALIRHNRQQNKLRQEQLIADQKSKIEDKLAIYNDKSRGYALKLPKDFVFTRYDPVTGDVYRSSAENTPFVVSVQLLPVELSLIYTNDRTTNYETNLLLMPIDNTIQQLTGSSNGTTVSGGIDIPGTKHKRGFFANYSVDDVSGQELDIDIIIVPKDDGSAVMITFTSLKREEKLLQPVFDVIIKSITIQPK